MTTMPAQAHRVRSGGQSGEKAGCSFEQCLCQPHGEQLERDHAPAAPDHAPSSQRSARNELLDGIVLASFERAEPDGWCSIRFHQGDGPQRARYASCASVGPGERVAVMFEQGDPSRPIVLGPVRSAPGDRQDPPPACRTPAPIHVEADADSLDLTAKNQITLRCGRSSITLTRAGKIILRGAYLLSRSSGANRIKGASVQIN